jgi:predicted PurR-regulated permease PerM
MVIVITSVINEGIALYDKLQSGTVNPAQAIEHVYRKFPQIQGLMNRLGMDLESLKADAINAALAGGKYLAQHTFTIGQNAFTFLLNLALMLYITFFMLRDGHKLLDLMMRALPLEDSRERMLFALFAEVTRATIKGNIVIAIVQGSIGGITLALLGVNGALLWGVLMALSSLIPSIGSALVWLPIALWLMATGDVTSAIILIGIGAGVIGLIDNLLRPVLVGRDTKLPDYLVLLSTLGGIALFGANGFIIGPLVAAVFLAFWGIFIREINVLVPDQQPQPVEDTKTPPTSAP